MYLKEFRKHIGLSQGDFAKKINIPIEEIEFFENRDKITFSVNEDLGIYGHICNILIACAREFNANCLYLLYGALPITISPSAYGVARKKISAFSSEYISEFTFAYCSFCYDDVDEREKSRVELDGTVDIGEFPILSQEEKKVQIIGKLLEIFINKIRGGLFTYAFLKYSVEKEAEIYSLKDNKEIENPYLNLLLHLIDIFKVDNVGENKLLEEIKLKKEIKTQIELEFDDSDCELLLKNNHKYFENFMNAGSNKAYLALRKKSLDDFFHTNPKLIESRAKTRKRLERKGK